MTRRQPPTQQDVSVTIAGTTYSGTYTVESGTVTVSYFGGTAPAGAQNAAQVGGSSAKHVARWLLIELVNKHHS